MQSEMEMTELQYGRGPSGAEALARLRAEARLIRRYGGQYRKLLDRVDHVDAVRDLVKRHGTEYGVMVREERTRAEQAQLSPAGRAA
jgi:hypothetical protein